MNESDMTANQEGAIEALRGLRKWLENDNPGFGMDEIQDLWTVVYAFEANLGLSVQREAIAGRLTAEKSIERIREILEDDVNYQEPSLMIGGIWDVCDRYANYVRSMDGRMIEVRPK